MLTTAGNLPAKYVIRTVGPVCRANSQPDAKRLAACYRNALGLANERLLRSIAFPAISTGAYGYPRELAAPVVSAAIETFLAKPTSLADIRLVFFDSRDAQIFLRHQVFSEGREE